MTVEKESLIALFVPLKEQKQRGDSDQKHVYLQRYLQYHKSNNTFVHNAFPGLQFDEMGKGIHRSGLFGNQQVCI